MSNDIELKEEPTRPILSVRARSSVEQLPQLCQRVYGEIIQYLGAIGEYPAGPPFAAYYNLDMQNLDVELGFPVAKKLPGKGELQASEIPGGKFASYLYVGPYADCGPAYDAVSRWITEKGYTPTGVAYEYYLNDPNAQPAQVPQMLIAMGVK